MSIFNNIIPPTVYNAMQQASQQDIYRMMIGATMSNSCCCDYGDVPHYTYMLNEKSYEHGYDLPKIDIVEWAKEQGLKISDDGKTITCYKVVGKNKEGKLISSYDPNFEYHVGEYAIAEDFNSNRLIECAAGLHGCNIKTADAFISYGLCPTKMFLELKVDISDPDNYVVPYEILNSMTAFDNRIVRPSSKFRFKKCFVSRAMNLKRVTKYVDKETGEEFEV